MSFERRFELPTNNELDVESTCTYDAYCNGEFDCEPCKYNKGDDDMEEYVRKALFVDVTINNEFGPLDWVDQTLYQENNIYTGKYSISFTGPCIQKDETCNSAGFRGREDGFFAKMNSIKNMLINCGMTADLIKFYADNECPYSEATINIHLDGGEL